MTVLYKRVETTLKELHTFSAQPLYKEAIRLQLNIVGPVHWIYYDVRADPNHRFQLDITLPVDRIEGEPAGCQFNEYPSFRYVGTTHLGPWDTLSTVYSPLISQIHQAGLELNGVFREVYIFWDMNHPTYNRTDIQIGIAG